MIFRYNYERGRCILRYIIRNKFGCHNFLQEAWGKIMFFTWCSVSENSKMWKLKKLTSNLLVLDNIPIYKTDDGF